MYCKNLLHQEFKIVNVKNKKKKWQRDYPQNNKQEGKQLQISMI